MDATPSPICSLDEGVWRDMEDHLSGIGVAEVWLCVQ